MLEEISRLERPLTEGSARILKRIVVPHYPGDREFAARTFLDGVPREQTAELVLATAALLHPYSAREYQRDLRGLLLPTRQFFGIGIDLNQNVRLGICDYLEGVGDLSPEEWDVLRQVDGVQSPYYTPWFTREMRGLLYRRPE